MCRTSWLGLWNSISTWKLFAAGFEAIEVELTRIYATGDAFGCLKSAKLDAAQIGATVDGKFKSALVRARKSL